MIAIYVVLTIFLRQQDSSESQLVESRNKQPARPTGERGGRALKTNAAFEPSRRRSEP